MAELYKNDKNFLVVKLNKDEALVCNFGFIDESFNHIVLDDNTNEEITGDMYYVAVLNRVFSKETCDEWLHNATRYDEDIRYEVQHYNYIADILNLKKV